jgi:hypothetical protein
MQILYSIRRLELELPKLSEDKDCFLKSAAEVYF